MNFTGTNVSVLPTEILTRLKFLDAGSWNDFAYLYNRVGKYKPAIAFADSAIKRFHPPLGNPYGHKAYSQIKLQKLSLARPNLEKCQQISPHYNKNYFFWSCYYSILNKKKEAVKHLELAVEKGFNYVKWIESEPSLNNIRNETGYKILVKELKELK